MQKENSEEKKIINIIVEGISHPWPKDEISYLELVSLEFPEANIHPEITYSVKYSKGHGNKPEGIFVEGQYLKVKEGMIFNVSETGQS